MEKIQNGYMIYHSPIITAPNSFKSEITEPDPAYYHYDTAALTPVEDQMATLLAMLGLSKTAKPLPLQLNSIHKTEEKPLMAVPFLTDLGRHLGIGDPLGNGYPEMIKVVLSLSNFTTGFKEIPQESTFNPQKVVINSLVRGNLVRQENNHRLFDFKPKKARTLREKSLRFFVLPVNPGSSTAGYSARNALYTALNNDQLCLGCVQLACILMYWPERLTSAEHPLWIYCAGDQYDPEGKGTWSDCPSFFTFEKKIGIDYCDSHFPNAGYGSFSAQF